jgi:hypothetical protein
MAQLDDIVGSASIARNDRSKLRRQSQFNSSSPEAVDPICRLREGSMRFSDSATGIYKIRSPCSRRKSQTGKRGLKS